MKKFLILSLLLLFQVVAIANSPYKIKKQSYTIKKILKKESSTTALRRLHDEINQIDHTYSNLYNKILNGKKIVVFFDPAHGKLKNGQWQGGVATNRLSCTNKPEEFYSIKISRKMYNLLKNNPFIEIQSTTDFTKVLQGSSDTYKNIPFSKTIKLAKKHNAFIIISEHLNNVSMKFKADGVINLQGIHITKNKKEKKYLTNTGVYSGFLTLYNKLDASGFSKSYAFDLKKRLKEKGLKANNWELGAVGDDRFSYFTDFPISVIYESGFISNPKEEKNLQNEEYIDNIVNSQYQSLLTTIENYFGINISKKKIIKTSSYNKRRIELLKLSRIAIFYLKIGKTKKALTTIKLMKKKFKGQKFKKEIKYYSNLAKKISEAEKKYKRYKRYRRSKRWRTRRRANNYLKTAKKIVYKKPIFSFYSKKYGTKKLGKKIRRKKFKQKITKSYIQKTKKSKYSKKIILPIAEGYSLEDSIKLALNPTPKKLNQLLRSFNQARKVTWHKKRKYSKKRKRRITYWKKSVKKIKFKKGIYIVSLSKNLWIKKAKKVSSVRLNPAKYQNQQYLKNSFLSNREYKKTL